VWLEHKLEKGYRKATELEKKYARDALFFVISSSNICRNNSKSASFSTMKILFTRVTPPIIAYSWGYSAGLQNTKERYADKAHALEAQLEKNVQSIRKLIDETKTKLDNLN